MLDQEDGDSIRRSPHGNESISQSEVRGHLGGTALFPFDDEAEPDEAEPAQSEGSCPFGGPNRLRPPQRMSSEHFPHMGRSDRCRLRGCT